MNLQSAEVYGRIWRGLESELWQIRWSELCESIEADISEEGDEMWKLNIHQLVQHIFAAAVVNVAVVAVVTVIVVIIVTAAATVAATATAAAATAAAAAAAAAVVVLIVLLFLSLDQNIWSKSQEFRNFYNNFSTYILGNRM